MKPWNWVTKQGLIGAAFLLMLLYGCIPPPSTHHHVLSQREVEDKLDLTIRLRNDSAVPVISPTFPYLVLRIKPGFDKVFVARDIDTLIAMLTPVLERDFAAITRAQNEGRIWIVKKPVEFAAIDYRFQKSYVVILGGEFSGKQGWTLNMFLDSAERSHKFLVSPGKGQRF